MSEILNRNTDLKEGIVSKATPKSDLAKLTYTRREAAEAIGIGTTMLDCLIRRSVNPLPAVKIGRKVLIPVDKLMAWLDMNSMNSDDPGG